MHTLSSLIHVLLNSVREAWMWLFLVIGSVQTGTDIPNDVFGGTLTEIGQSNMPAGGSPQNQNVEFLPGVVRTRGGLQINSSYSGIAGGPWQVRYAKSYGPIPESQENVVLLWNPSTATGVMAVGASQVGSLFGYGNVQPWNPSAGDPTFTGPLARSISEFGREYIAISQGRYGWDIPRQWDGANFDRVSQCGPGAGPLVANFLPPAAAISTAGSGTGVSIAAAPTGAVRSAPQTFKQLVYNGGPPNQRSSYTLVNVTYDTIVTFTTSVAHGASVNQQVVVTGCGDFNGTFVVLSVPSGTTLTVAQTSPNLGETGGGGTLAPLTFSLQRLSNRVTIITAAAHNFQAGWTVVLSGIADQAVGTGILSISQLNGTATCVMHAAHGLVPGSAVDITGTTNYNNPSGNPYVVLAVPNPTTFTFAFASIVAAETTGTVSSVLNGTFQILATPTTTSFIYSSLGPNLAFSPSAGTATVQGNVTAGNHQLSVVFITRQGSFTRPAPPVNFTAQGNQLLQLTNIPTGPANVIGRLIIATGFITPPATTADFFAIRGPNTLSGNLFQINDNTTTAMVLDFTDSQLVSGFSADYLFDLIELGEVGGFISYAGRLFAWGELAQVSDLINLEFNGGWNLGAGVGGSDIPLGWTNDSTNGAGAVRISGGGVFGDAYQITFATGEGMIEQGVYADAFGDPILTVGTKYGVRLTAFTVPSTSGTLSVEFFSQSLGSLALFSTSFSGGAGVYRITMGSMNNALPSSLPSDIVLRVYGTGTAGTITIDRIELYPVNQPINTTTVRASRVNDPEAFDGVQGIIQPSLTNGQAVRAMYILRDSLYIVCDRSLFVTKDTGGEPATWTIDPVSGEVGAFGPDAVGMGEDWAVKANRHGLYIYLGREPQKISHEIQTLWNQINFAAAGKVWVAVDAEIRRIYVGAPVNGANEVNQIFVMSYETQDTSEMIADLGTLRFSPYTGRRLILEQGRKWTIWNFSNSSGAVVNIPFGGLVEQSNGTAQFLLGGNADNNLYFIDPTNRGNDNGAAVASSYTTHTFPTSDEEQQLQLRSHMHGFSFSRWYVSGSGRMTISLFENNLSASPKTMAVRMTNPPQFDEEITLDEAKSERWILQFATSDLNSWFQMERITRTVETDRNELVRGSNYQ